MYIVCKVSQACGSRAVLLIFAFSVFCRVDMHRSMIEGFSQPKRPSDHEWC
jgi:hypothetical protein